MMDFPANPVPGDKFNPGTGSIYTWDGVAWNLSPVNVATAQARNLIVNPCMAVTQENGGNAGTVNAYYAVDQWRLMVNGTGLVASLQASYTNVNPSGSPGRLTLKTTTAKPSLAAGDYASISSPLEGVSLYPLAYPTSTPQQAVLRFGFNGPAGTYSVALRNAGNTIAWIGQFTISAAQANTDTTQVLVIPPPPSGYSWPGGGQLQSDLWITGASSPTHTAPGTGWQAGNYICGPGQFNLLGTVNNQIQVWDIGLYADPDKTGVPPPFQVSKYTDDLRDCTRYWQIGKGSLQCDIVSGRWYSTEVQATGLRTSPTTAVYQNIQVNAGLNQPFTESTNVYGTRLTAQANATTNSVFDCLVSFNARM